MQIHLLKKWFSLSDPAIEALYENRTHAPVRTPGVQRADLRKYLDHVLPALAGEVQLAPAMLAVIHDYLQERPLAAPGHHC